MKDCINQVWVASLVAIATAFPLIPPGYAQSVDIDGLYLSSVANSCSSNIGGTFTADVWNCIAAAVRMTVFAQTGYPQPRINGPYISRVGDACSAKTEGSFTVDVWDCMAQSIMNDAHYRSSYR